MLYFEPWFTIMGAVLIAAAVAARRSEHASTLHRMRTPHLRVAATTLVIAGLLTSLWGIFTIDVLPFILPGVALTAAGAAIGLFTTRQEHGEQA